MSIVPELSGFVLLVAGLCSLVVHYRQRVNYPGS